MSAPAGRAAWRERVWHIIFESNTRAAKAFDVALLLSIVASVVVVLLDSVPDIRASHGFSLDVAEAFFTALFTVEYALRLATVRSPASYARSFFGIVDLLAVLPTYLSLVIPGAEHLLVIRALRLLRVFRIFKLARFLGEANVLVAAMRSSARKVIVFLGTLLVLIVIIGTAMFLVEGSASGFDSIPRAMYWAVVTITTVGYGDIVPQTVAGRFFAAAVMILGYAIIAIPTGIFTAEIVHALRKPVTGRTCPDCLAPGHELSARFCKECGVRLTEP